MNIIFFNEDIMFNFNLQNKAFEELNAEQFRVVYFFNNTLSMVNKTNNTPNNNTIEMYNGYMMDKLGLSVRMIQYHIKTLEQLGYIKVVRPIGRNARKQPNKITINNAINCALSENNTFKTINDVINDAIDCALSDENANTLTLERTLQADKNVPLETNVLKNEHKPINDAIDCALSNENVKNNAINDAINCAIDCTPNKKEIKNNKNNNITTGILELKDLGSKVTEIKKENKKEKVNEMKNAVLNEMELEVKSNNNITSTSGEKNTNSNLKIDNKTDCNNSSAQVDDELFDEIFGLSSNETSNKAAGDVQTLKMEQLPTNEDENASEGLKTQNNAYSLQEWMTKYNKLIFEVENTDVEAVQFDILLDEGCKLFDNFPIKEGNYKRQMQDLRYWVARKLDFKKSFKISEHWNKYYRAA